MAVLTRLSGLGEKPGERPVPTQRGRTVALLLLLLLLLLFRVAVRTPCRKFSVTSPARIPRVESHLISLEFFLVKFMQ